ncbi:MAG: hypothetical protein ACKO0W_11640, partial [Planctomycetota bacterium]
MSPILTIALPLAFALAAVAQDAAPKSKRDPRIDATRITRIAPAEPMEPALRCEAPRPVLRIAARAEDAGLDAARFEAARAAIRRGLAALATMQTPEGRLFVDREVAPTDMEPRKRAASVAVTALALKAFEQAPDLGDEAARRRTRDAVLAAITDPAERLRVTEGGIGNYAMSAIASGLAAVGDPDAAGGVEVALTWLRESQWDSGEGIDGAEDWFGGAGYGNGKRPDLSNTQMML